MGTIYLYLIITYIIGFTQSFTGSYYQDWGTKDYIRGFFHSMFSPITVPLRYGINSYLKQ